MKQYVFTKKERQAEHKNIRAMMRDTYGNQGDAMLKKIALRKIELSRIERKANATLY
jgi:hypothetical protein